MKVSNIGKFRLVAVGVGIIAITSNELWWESDVLFKIGWLAFLGMIVYAIFEWIVRWQNAQSQSREDNKR